MATTKLGFWKVFWPVLISSIIVSILGWIFWIIIFASAFSTEEKTYNRAVLHMTLTGEIAERSSTKVNSGSFSIDKKIGLADILIGLKEAKNDPTIKGIFLELGNVNCGMATANEIRKGMNDFQKNGKFIVAYLNGEVVTQKQYFISSAAKEIYGFHSSPVEMLGLGTEIMYLKGMFDKIGVEMQVIRGSNNDFKSAVEPYFRTDMSDSSRVQVNRYLESIWYEMRTEISKSRKISADKINELAENVSVQRMTDALKYNLIDGIKYRDEIEEIVAKKGKLSDLSKIEKFERYAKRKFKLDQTLNGAANIAVIIGEGAISVDGDEMTSKEVCKDFNRVRKDNNIKVVVFRVNSPGGSALASEEIWREVMLTQKKKKVIVSMGDLAASGGYYVAAPADYIFAEKTTITGSIGVFGVIPYIGKAFEDNLGVTFDRVQTNKHANLSLNRKLTEEELLMIQKEVDLTYAQFKQRVADGRKMTMKRVQELARGRVWTGADAIKIGLVDAIGGLESAIAYAAKVAKIAAPKVKYFPVYEEKQLDQLLERIGEDEDNEQIMVRQQLPESFKRIMTILSKVEEVKGIQMRLPFQLIY